MWPRVGVNGRALELDDEMQEILERLKEAAPGKTYQTVKAVVESHDHLVELLREARMMEDRLLEMLRDRGGQADGDGGRQGNGFGNAAGRRKGRRRHRRLVGSKRGQLSG